MLLFCNKNVCLNSKVCKLGNLNVAAAKFLVEITTKTYHEKARVEKKERRITASPSFNGKFKLLLLNSYQNNSKPSVIKSFLWYLRVNLPKP